MCVELGEVCSHKRRSRTSAAGISRWAMRDGDIWSEGVAPLAWAARCRYSKPVPSGFRDQGEGREHQPEDDVGAVVVLVHLHARQPMGVFAPPEPERFSRPRRRITCFASE
jgi:hypothetical protein